jgi:hypothetical protein
MKQFDAEPAPLRTRGDDWALLDRPTTSLSLGLSGALTLWVVIGHPSLAGSVGVGRASVEPQANAGTL